MFQRSLLALAAVACSFTAMAASAQTLAPTDNDMPVAARSVQVLPPDVSRTLKFNRMPATQGSPFVIGSRWQCQEGAYGLERCDLVLVICTNDQSLCVQV